MAKIEQYSRSVLGASDEVADIYCEPCHKVGHIAIAEGYCVNCPEYLCRPCYKIHRQHKALANHVLLDKDSMPLTIDSSRRVTDVCETKCPIHPSKVVELFCVTCDKLVCTICVATDHRQCEEVKHIPDMIKDREYDEEFQDFNEDIKSTAKALSEHMEKFVKLKKEMRKLAKQELKHQRAEVNRFFDQLEKEIHEQITAIEERNQATLKAASDRLNYMKTDLDQIKNDMEAKNTAQRCELFITMKQTQEKMRTLHDQFDRMQQELRIQHYTLVPSEQIQAMMRTTTEICRIATARLESEIDITDKTDPCIYVCMDDLTLIHGHYCVALDNGNTNIKVIDTNSKCVTSEITIEAKNIWSVTSVGDDQVAVSVLLSDDRDQIQFFTVSASGIIQRTKQLYDINSWYHGMVHCAGNIYGVGDHRVNKLSMTGKIIRTIHTYDTGFMEGIAVSADGQTLYVTCCERDSVTSMTLHGKVKAIFEDKDLKDPCRITVDKHGYVYVCSRGTGNIHQLTADLNKVQVFVGTYGVAITYSSTENKLYISNGIRIHMYSLDFK